jgi:hypothetical protein
MPTTTFFTSCNEGYEAFVLPYIASVLHHNDDTAVEICVQQPEQFTEENKAALAIIAQRFPDRVLIRGGQFSGVLAHSVRFLEEPKIRADYSYIGDIDVLVLDRNITDVHQRHMQRTGLPYSNILRPNTKRLTGLHFTRTDVHYPLRVPDDAELKGNDEQLLYRLVENKGLPFPDPADTFRPLHGYHFSLQRTPTAAPGKLHWSLEPMYLDAYLNLVGSSFWEDLSPLFHPAYRFLLAIQQSALQSRHPDREIYRIDEVKRLFKGLAGTRKA